MVKDNKNKRIMVILLVLLLVVFGVVGYNVHRLSKEPYFTQYKLTAEELKFLFWYAEVNITPDDWQEPDKRDWPDYSYYVIEESLSTKAAIDEVNKRLFEDRTERMAYEMAKGYGFTTENWITVEWVMEHPKEAAQIFAEMWH